ncbi:unnamed protein product, partial [Mesorhabditis spiculigera]
MILAILMWLVTAGVLLLSVLLVTSFGHLDGILTFIRDRLLGGSYWKRKGVPCLEFRPIIGSLMESTDPHNPWYHKLPGYTAKFGPVWGYQEGYRNILVVATPALAKQVLVSEYAQYQQRRGNPIFQTRPTDDSAHLVEAYGQRWRRLRRIVAHQLSPLNLYPTITDSTHHFVNHLLTFDGQEIEMLRNYQELTIDIISRMAMGQKGSQLFSNQYVDDTKAFLSRDPRNPIFLSAAMFSALRPLARKFFLTAGRLTEQPPFRQLKVIEEAIRLRKIERAGKADIESKDFIDDFLNATGNETNLELEALEGLAGPSVGLSKGMNVAEVAVHCLLFLIAGFDSTSSGMAYASYYLAKYPRVQELLQEELDAEFPDPNAPMPYDKVQNLPFLNVVVKEVMRLEPTGTVAVTRIAQNDGVLDNIKLAKGDCVQIDVRSLQRSTEIWGDDAMEFKPERWIPL